MVVLNAEQGETVVALGPEFGDILTTEHVAIHEDRPALVAHQVGDKKAAEGEGCALLGVSLPLVDSLNQAEA